MAAFVCSAARHHESGEEETNLKIWIASPSTLWDEPAQGLDEQQQGYDERQVMTSAFCPLSEVR